MTIYGKALDDRTEDPISGDRFADEALQKIDFDFEKLKPARGREISLPVRAKHIDGWVRGNYLPLMQMHPTSSYHDL